MLHAALKGFSEFPLRVDGKILDYIVTDINADKKNDIVVLFASRGKTFLGVFLQNWNGFSFDPNQQFQLPAKTFAIDIAPILGNNFQDICFITEDGVVAIPFANGRFQAEKQRTVFSTSITDPGFGSHPIFFPLYQKYHSNGKYQLLLPRDGNLVLYHQERNGRFIEDEKLESSNRVPIIAPMKKETVKGHRTLDGVRIIDLNNDGRMDICSVHIKGCVYYLQNDDGSFSSTPTAALSFAENENTRLIAIDDCNGDALPDLVFISESKTNFLSNKRTTVGMYFGQRSSDNQITYKSSADRQWVFTGVCVLPQIVDYNSDGIADLVVTKAIYSLGNLVTSLLGNKTKLQIEFYRSNKGEFSNTPDAIRETTLAGKIYDDTEFMPTVAFGDVSGDRKKDFILGEESAIFCYPGSQNRTFESTSTDEIPYAPATVTDVDLLKIDSDQRDDICIIDRKQNPGIIHIYLSR